MNGEPNVEQGLCGHCVHRRLLRSRRSVFVRCSLADGDPRFHRYPALPVLACIGFNAAIEASAAESNEAAARGGALQPAGDDDVE